MKNTIRISQYIIDYRKKHGLTQKSFTKLLGVSTMAVSKWEREDLFMLPFLSETLGVSIDEMLGKDVSSETKE